MVNLRALFLFFASFFSSEARLQSLRCRIDGLDQRIIFALLGFKQKCCIEKRGEITADDVGQIVGKIPSRDQQYLTDDFLWNLVADIAGEFGNGTPVDKFIKLVNKRVCCARKIGQLKKAMGKDIFDSQREEAVRQNAAELAYKAGGSTTLAVHIMGIIIAYSREAQL